MLKKLVHEKINEVFLEYQKANHIISGDIEPFDAEYLDSLEERLAQVIEAICAKQPKVDIDNLPKEFNFKSKINTLVNMYHAVEREDDYLVTSDSGCMWHFDKAEIHHYLLKGDYVIIEEEPNYDEFTPSWYVYTDSEGIAHSETFGKIDMDRFLYIVSKRIAFDDLSDETMQKIYYKGKEIEYVGWQPCMKFEYKDLNGNTVWVGTFEDWDH